MNNQQGLPQLNTKETVEKSSKRISSWNSWILSTIIHPYVIFDSKKGTVHMDALNDTKLNMLAIYRSLKMEN